MGNRVDIREFKMRLRLRLRRRLRRLPGLAFVLILPCLLLVVKQGHAQAEFRKYTNEYLNIGVGGRAHGMAGAVAASTHSGYAAFWNPAGLGTLEPSLQVCAMHAEWFAGIVNYDFIGVTKALNEERGSFGSLAVIRMGIDNIPNTLNLFDPDGSINYDNISSFSAADYGILLSYGQVLGKLTTAGKRFSFGGSAKIIHRRIGPFATAWGFGLDAGLKYANENGWSFALMGRDITTTFNAWKISFTEDEKRVLQETGNILPKNSIELAAPRIIPAVARKFPAGERSTLLFELDVDITFDGERNTLIHSERVNLDPHIGAEFGFAERLFIRGGLGNIQSVKDDLNPEQINTIVQPHFGIGLTFGPVVIDYALTNVGNAAGTSFSHIFSLSLNFKKKDEVP